MHLALGLALAVLIGITLGLLGGGGAILTVPAFVYVMNVEPKAAIAMTLPVVGISALIAGARHWRAGNVELAAAVGFGAMAMIGSLTAARAAKLIPGVVQLALLGVVMLVAATLMFRGKSAAASDTSTPLETAPHSRAHTGLMAGVGLGVGALTGLVGVGGGFLFVPALVILGGLPMKRAVGTSLIVIAINTIGGILGYHGQAAIDWPLVAGFTVCCVGGSLIGARLVGRVPQERLRRGFAWFLIAMAVLILWQNRTVVMHPSAALHRAERPDRFTTRPS